jgi:hypothetical protein
MLLLLLQLFGAAAAGLAVVAVAVEEAVTAA